MIAVFPEAIVRKIGIQRGAQLLDGTVQRSHGNEALVGRYRSRTAQGTLVASAAFRVYEGLVFKLPVSLNRFSIPAGQPDFIPRSGVSVFSVMPSY